MDADQQVDWLDGQLLQPDRADQRRDGLKHLDHIHRVKFLIVCFSYQSTGRFSAAGLSHSLKTLCNEVCTCSGSMGADPGSLLLRVFTEAEASAVSGM